MKIEIDDQKHEIIVDGTRHVPLYSPEGFKVISDLWVKVGWDQKHLYTFSWLGRPIIQIPDDILRIQEVIYQLKPDLIIETGIAHGGSLILSASICHAIGKGKVVGIDIDIRAHNRKAIEAHELFPYITLIEGDSSQPQIFDQVKALAKGKGVVMVILDSAHSYEHVSKELKLFGQLVTVGSYIVATDGSQEYLNQTPRAQKQYPQCANWPQDNPKRAALDFVASNANFKIVEPKFPFSESAIDFRITHWPCAFIQRIK